MINIAANIFFFLMGIHLAMQLIAALYRIIDLWYRIGDFLFPIIRSILSWTVAIGLVLWYLAESNERAFIGGGLFFLFYHVTIFWLIQSAIRFKKWRQR